MKSILPTCALFLLGSSLVACGSSDPEPDSTKEANPEMETATPADERSPEEMSVDEKPPEEMSVDEKPPEETPVDERTEAEKLGAQLCQLAEDSACLDESVALCESGVAEERKFAEEEECLPLLEAQYECMVKVTDLQCDDDGEPGVCSDETEAFEVCVGYDDGVIAEICDLQTTGDCSVYANKSECVVDVISSYEDALDDDCVPELDDFYSCLQTSDLECSDNDGEVGATVCEVELNAYLEC